MDQALLERGGLIHVHPLPVRHLELEEEFEDAIEFDELMEVDIEDEDIMAVHENYLFEDANEYEGHQNVSGMSVTRGAFNQSVTRGVLVQGKESECCGVAGIPLI